MLSPASRNVSSFLYTCASANATQPRLLTGRPSTTYHCISQRCSLCGFLLREGEPSVVVKRDGTTSSIWCKPNPSIKAGLSSEYFNFCYGACSKEYHVPTCHQECFDIMHGESIFDLLGALTLVYQPPNSETSNRAHQVQMCVESRLARAFPQLPPEITSAIALHLLPTFTTAERIGHFKLKARGIIEAKLTEKIWVRYVSLGGFNYVASFSNEPSPNSVKWTLIFDPKHPFKKLFIAYDSLGVRDIIFGDEFPVNCDGEHIWWQYSEVSDIAGALQGHMDGLKIQRLISPALGPELTSQPLNTQPTLRFVSLNPCNGIPSGKSSIAPRLLNVVEYTEDISGISVCLNRRTHSIHFHRPGEDQRFYNATQITHQSVWLYMPLAAGEIITEIWMQITPTGARSGPYLAFKTSSGRLRTFGEYPNPKCRYKPELNLIYTQNQPGNHLFLDAARGIVQGVGFETEAPATKIFPKLQDVPAARFPLNRNDFEPCFFTTALLDGVTTIIPCRRKALKHGTIITGLILVNEKHYKTSVGSVRLDLLGDALVGMDGVRLKFSLDQAGRPSVNEIEPVSGLSKDQNIMDSEQDGLSITCMMNGRIDWWLSRSSCQIYYGDQASPPMSGR